MRTRCQPLTKSTWAYHERVGPKVAVPNRKAFQMNFSKVLGSYIGGCGLKGHKTTTNERIAQTRLSFYDRGFSDDSWTVNASPGPWLRSTCKHHQGQRIHDTTFSAFRITFHSSSIALIPIVIVLHSHLQGI